jgi:RNA polymerase sigma-70 factor (ECF subfamily)
MYSWSRAAVKTYPDLAALPDDALVRLVRSGNVNGPWEELDRRHRPRAAHVARSVLSKRDRGACAEAEELAHDGMTEAYLKLALYDESRPFWPWVSRIIHNRAIDWLRKDRPKYALPAVVTAGPSPLEALAEKETRRELRRRLELAVAGLRPRERDFFRRFFQGGESSAALAGAAGLAEQTVRGVLSRAKKRVLARLGGVKLTNGELRQLLG